jgi:RimJ/RimL family protein N-acetyltransferase
MSGIVIETSRLRLRAFLDEDLAALVALANDWSVAEWLAALPHPYGEEHGSGWIAHVRANHETGRPVSFAIALRDGDRVIGGCGLDGSTGDDSAEAAIGYWLGKPYWRKGYGREAVAALIDYGLTRLGLPSIRAYTDPANATSQKLLLACGMIPAGEIALTHPTHHGATQAPLFRIAAERAR